MFGLMRHGPRAPYCGTCKTLGAVYGQKTRLLLNHDIAFLAEVLLDLAGVELTGKAYRSFNCATLPRDQNTIPLVMRYAAAVTIALAHWRIADHRRDRASRSSVPWIFDGRLFFRPFRRAAKHLRDLEFPLDGVEAMLATQPEREAHPQSLAHVAEPTATATAEVFAHGVLLAGRPDRREDAWRLGYGFGELIYLLDAFEDRKQDAQNGDFNPLLFFGDVDRAAREEILSRAEALSREMAPAHAARLRCNVEERLGVRMRVLQPAGERPLRVRARQALAFGRELRNKEAAGFFK